MRLVDDGQPQISFRLVCQGCYQGHHPFQIRKSKGYCQSCRGETWRLDVNFVQSGTDVSGIPLLLQVHQRTTAQSRFRYEDISRETVLYLTADDRLIEERIMSFTAAKSQE